MPASSSRSPLPSERRLAGGAVGPRALLYGGLASRGPIPGSRRPAQAETTSERHFHRALPMSHQDSQKFNTTPNSERLSGLPTSESSIRNLTPLEPVHGTAMEPAPGSCEPNPFAINDPASLIKQGSVVELRGRGSRTPRRLRGHDCTTSPANRTSYRQRMRWCCQTSPLVTKSP